PDWRLERPDFETVEVVKDGEVRYEVRGNLNAPVPPIRDSKYLSKEQCIELYRWMLLNRKMGQQLEILYKQTKVVGGVYFGLGQEACSCAAAYALAKDDWFAPMIRNQGALLVRGFHPRDVMMQYMAKADSPTKGKDGPSHYGAIGYGVPGVIVDGTDACQMYDATHEAVERAHRGEGASLIEAKMMRMKGHAIHDAAAYVPKEMFDYWRKRDPITRFEKYLLDKK